MRIRIHYNKSPQENAAFYYNKAKELERKAERAEVALKDLQSKKPPIRRIPLVKVDAPKEEWFMHYGWSFTSKGKLILFGRDAQENARMYKKMDNKDLWFHADIKGASSVILKEGKEADKEEKREAATLAGLFSKFFSGGYSIARVYALGKEHIRPLGKGKYAMSGKREWYEVPLKGYFTTYKESWPHIVAWKPGTGVAISPGNLGKNEAAKIILEKLRLNPEMEGYVKALLPPGGIAIEEL